jgi:hypothetical protein
LKFSERDLVYKGGNDELSFALAMCEPGNAMWRIDFEEWKGLSHGQRHLLLVAIGECGGEWWGNGKVEFWSREAALEAIGMAAGLGVVTRLPARTT